MLNRYTKYQGKYPYTEGFRDTFQNSLELEIAEMLRDRACYPQSLVQATMIVFYGANIFHSAINGVLLVSAIDLVFSVKKYIDNYIRVERQTKESYHLHAQVIMLALISVVRPDLVIEQF